jgi:hypothetical protein
VVDGEALLQFRRGTKARLEKLCRRAEGIKVLFSQQPLNGLQSNSLSGSSSVSKGKALVQGVGQRSHAKILIGTGQKQGHDCLQMTP